MKLAWFAGTTMRIHVGGSILVTDADGAPGWADSRELAAGADRQFGLAGTGLPAVDPQTWRRHRAASPLDETGKGDVEILKIVSNVLLIDAPGEPVLVLAASPNLPPAGRWANDAVVVLFGAGEAIIAAATVLLDVAEPRLLALAADEPAIDLAVDELREHLDGTALISLEPGLAVEV